MKALEQEAEEYSQSYDECDIWIQGVAKECYIAGANSKWVESEKIKAQIEILEGVNGDYYYSITIYEMIHKLKQQLKQLFDETKI
jgi:hypothetical protein